MFTSHLHLSFATFKVQGHNNGNYLVRSSDSAVREIYICAVHLGECDCSMTRGIPLHCLGANLGKLLEGESPKFGNGVWHSPTAFGVPRICLLKNKNNTVALQKD